MLMIVQISTGPTLLLSLFLPICVLASACGREAPPAHKNVGETRSAFAAASGVTRAETGRKPRIVPLHALSGDVEILSGDPEKAGEAFVMRIRELPGTRVPLHSHSVDENITVVQGTWVFRCRRQASAHFKSTGGTD
jgi:quercetin dioxygenase-like cupin family protein